MIDDIDPTETAHDHLLAACSHLAQAFEMLRAEGRRCAAHRALVIAEYAERLDAMVIKADNAAALDAVDEMLAVAGKAWGE
jgi:hypothetical protein